MNDRAANPDRTLTILSGIAAFLGTILILDAGYPQAMARGDGFLFAEFRKHLMWVALAACAYWFVAHRPIGSLLALAKPAFYLCALACTLVFFPPFGIEMNGAKRWVGYGSLTLQPAELMKPAVILFLALALSRSLAKLPPPPRDWTQFIDRRVVPCLARAWPALATIAVVLLIEREPDMGTALMVAAAAFGTMLFSRIPLRTTISVFLGLCLLGVGILMLEGYRLDRIFNHGDRWNPVVLQSTGYQPANSELAMASGGLAGAGAGQGRAKHVLPAATTDFVATTASEEFGIVGVVVIVSLLSAISVRLVLLAGLIEDTFRRITVGAVGWWIGVQSVLNLLMAGALLPPVGVPLPFFSYGGSSWLALGIALGIAQSAIQGKEKEGARELRRNGRRHRRPRLSRA